MARFVEGQDIELVKDHSYTIQDDEKLLKIRQKKIQQEEARKVEQERLKVKKGQNNDKGKKTEKTGYVDDRQKKPTRGGQTCYKCNQVGHIARDCKVPQNEYKPRDASSDSKDSNIDPWDYDSKPSNRDPGTKPPQGTGLRGNRGGRGRGRGGEARGGYRDDYQRDQQEHTDDDPYYVKKEPNLYQNINNYSDKDSDEESKGNSQQRGRGGLRGARGGPRGRGRGGNNSRGGQFN